MRTKEAIDRETQEEQERTWIHLLHQQAPPLTRRGRLHSTTPASPLDLATAAPRESLVPLAPLVSNARESPFEAAYASATLYANTANANSDHANTNNNGHAYSNHSVYDRSHIHTHNHTRGLPWPQQPYQPQPQSQHSHFTPLESSHTNSHSHNNSQSQSQSHHQGQGHNASGLYASMVQLAPPKLPPVATRPRPKQRPATMSGLLELLPKRRREEHVDPRDAMYEDELKGATASMDHHASGHTASLSKRACLPKKCDFPLCKNSSRSRGFCYSHGGGRRCRVDGCANGAVSRDLCKRHGGGRRCRISGCKSSSESGGLCYSHGGGRRCQLEWCNARAKKGGLCATHVENPNALPPPEQVDGATATAAATATTPTASTADAVNPQVIETLLSLAKSPREPEEVARAAATESDSATVDSPTSPASATLLFPRPTHRYSIASILN